MIPIIILYELSIVGARLIEKRGAQEFDDDDYEDIGPEPDNPRRLRLAAKSARRLNYA